MEKQKNDVINNLPNSNVNEYNVQNNMREQNNLKKINICAIISFLVAGLEIFVAIKINAEWHEVQAGGAYYMAPLGITFLKYFISLPMAILAIITGIIGLVQSYKYEKGYSCKWMAILGIVVSIINLYQCN